jgi:hypothetical protein
MLVVFIMQENTMNFDNELLTIDLPRQKLGLEVHVRDYAEVCKLAKRLRYSRAHIIRTFILEGLKLTKGAKNGKKG